MDIVLIMGMIAGFFIGVAFSLFFTSMLAHRVISILQGDKKKRKQKEDADDDDGANFWKPKGWKPDLP